MTSTTPLGAAATPAAAGAPVPAVAPARAGAGEGFLALVLQLLGPAAATGTDGSPAGGASATVPGDGTAAGSPLTGKSGRTGRGAGPATDEDGGAPDDVAEAGSDAVPADVAAGATVVPPALLQAAVAAAPVPDRPTVAGTGADINAAGPADGPVPAATGTSSGTPDGAPGVPGDQTAAPDAAQGAPATPAPGTAVPAASTPVGVAAPAAAVPGEAVASRLMAQPITEPVTHQVFSEIVRVAGTGAGPRRVTVRLQPESLGEVRVVLSVRDGSLRVSLAADGSAHHTLLEGAPELQRLLQAAGSPDARIVVRDLPGAAPASPGQSPATTTGPGQGAGQELPTGTGHPGTGHPGHPGAGQTPDRRTPPHGSSTAMDGIHDPASPPRRTESVTPTRTAGVDVTM